MKTLLLFFLFAPLLLWAKPEIIKPKVKTPTSFAIVVDKQSYDRVKSSIEAYRDAIERDGIATYILVDEWENPDAIREILKKLIHPDDRIVVLTTHCSLNLENDRNECEFRAPDGKGGYRRLHALQQCLRSADGSHLLQITLTDITLQYQIIEQRRTWHE